jgi:hypothetical protein
VDDDDEFASKWLNWVRVVYLTAYISIFHIQKITVHNCFAHTCTH